MFKFVLTQYMPVSGVSTTLTAVVIEEHTLEDAEAAIRAIPPCSQGVYNSVTRLYFPGQKGPMVPEWMMHKMAACGWVEQADGSVVNHDLKLEFLCWGDAINACLEVASGV